MRTYLNTMLLLAQMKLGKFAREERGDVNIVSIVVLIGIAVVLAVIFRGAIEDLLDTMLDSIEGNALEAIADAEG